MGCPVLYFTDLKLVENKTFRKTTNAAHSADRPCTQKQHTCYMIFMNFFEKVNFNQQMTKSMKNFPGGKVKWSGA